MNSKRNIIQKHDSKSRLKIVHFFVGLIFISLSLVSCGNSKSAVYFDQTANVSFRSKTENLEPIIQKNDLLSIVVSSINPDAAQMFNPANKVTAESSTNSGNTNRVSGYLVDQDGSIRFPILGKIEAAGKTKKALREEITSLLEERKLLLEPIVDIRYLNYKISVLGEVRNPSVLNIPNEKISMLEALGLAGDITIDGRRDNVVLIREENGVKQIRRIDLTTNEIFNSPYYYLKSNDIIYVEPTKAKIASASETRQWIPVILSAFSVAIVTIVSFRPN